MLCLAYDTETSGLPLWNEPSEHPAQPRVVQLAAELFDDESGDVLHAMNFIIKPDGWTIPDEVAAVHGITTEIATKHGIHMRAALPLFLSLWKQCDHRVAHNESFDMRMVRIEIKRDTGFSEDFSYKWKAAPAYCTQAKSSPILNLPPTAKMLAAGRKHAKSPNLGEAFEFFTGRKLEGAHNASVDVAACKAVYLAIKRGQGEATKVAT